MVKTHTLYLSTLTTTGQYVPVNKTNLANVSWNVNWRDVFSPDDEGKPMRVKCSVASRNVATANASWDSVIGTLRVSLPDVKSNSTNGLIVSLLRIINNPSSNSGHVIDVNTLSENGVESYVPFGQQIFSVGMYNLQEQLNANTAIGEYNIIFIFEIDE